VRRIDFKARDAILRRGPKSLAYLPLPEAILTAFVGFPTRPFRGKNRPGSRPASCLRKARRPHCIRSTKTATRVRKRTVRKLTTGLLAVAFVAGMGAFAWKACATDEMAPPSSSTETPAAGDTGAAPAGDTGAAPAGGECCKAGDTMPPLDLIKNTPKHGLHNPYNGKWDEVAEEGHKKFLSFSCNGCHGGGGGGTARRWWSAPCRPSEASSRRRTIYGRSSPGSARLIRTPRARSTSPCSRRRITAI
jgi:hypothetical protein